jgi:hypothetical protein
LRVRAFVVFEACATRRDVTYVVTYVVTNK